MSWSVQFKGPRGEWITATGYFGDGGDGPDLRFYEQDYAEQRFAQKEDATRFAADHFRGDECQVVESDRPANSSFPWGGPADPRHPADAAWLVATRELLLQSTQGELAAALGVSVSQLHNWERGADRRTGAPCPIPRPVELAVEALVKRRLAGVIS